MEEKTGMPIGLNNIFSLKEEKRKKERKKKTVAKHQNKKKIKLDMLPSQTAYPAGFETSTPDWPQFPCYPANVMQVYELHEHT